MTAPRPITPNPGRPAPTQPRPGTPSPMDPGQRPPTRPRFWSYALPVAAVVWAIGEALAGRPE